MVPSRASTPEERKKLLQQLEKLWNVPPDLRLGQLIYDAVHLWLISAGKPSGDHGISNAIFYVEDNELLAIIGEFVMRNYREPAEEA